jgi:hypothetical protein
MPNSGVRKRHDPKSQLIAKSKKKALAEFMKLREGTSSGSASGVMSPRAAAKLLKMKMMRSRSALGRYVQAVWFCKWFRVLIFKMCNACWIQGKARRRTGLESDDAYCCIGGSIAFAFERKQRGSVERVDAEILRGAYSARDGC